MTLAALQQSLDMTVSPISWPDGGKLTAEWVHHLATSLDNNTRSGETPRSLSKVLPKLVKEKLFKACINILAKEPTLLRLSPGEDVKVNVVGDTHGQYHDVLKMLNLAGDPSPTNWYVFNGDFVDRGAWGVEVLTVLMAWKVAYPDCVYLLRGNHECEFCTEVYGYKRELLVKYGAKPGRSLYGQFMQLGAALPLAAMVGPKTLVLHGGLFRAPAVVKGDKGKGKGSKKKLNPNNGDDGKLTVGTLADLESASKGGVDPDGEGTSQIAGDVLWSDPAPDIDGLIPNDNRGIGTMFGPDATAAFMTANGVTLVLRSHEGPDARDDRPELPNVQEGFCVDHDVKGIGKLCTVFSAPDYPQFVDLGEKRYHNKGAYVVLTAEGEFAVPTPVAYTAVKPRPKCEPYYDVSVGGSDEEGPDGDLRVDHDDNSSEEEEEEEEEEEGDVDMWKEADEHAGPGSRTRSRGGGKNKNNGGGKNR